MTKADIPVALILFIKQASHEKRSLYVANCNRAVLLDRFEESISNGSMTNEEKTEKNEDKYSGQTDTPRS
jgi:hypothetical protein